MPEYGSVASALADTIGADEVALAGQALMRRGRDVGAARWRGDLSGTRIDLVQNVTVPRFGDPPGKGWFAIRGLQQGDRRLSDQLRGLDPIRSNCRQKTILDLGSAEGLISRHFCAHGATSAHCIELVPSRIATGRRMCPGNPVSFWCGDVDDFPAIHVKEPAMLAKYDIVLALAILHKLKRPDIVLRYLTMICREYLAIRLPDPVLNDRRSGFMKLDVPAFLSDQFDSVLEARTYRNEWTATFKKR